MKLKENEIRQRCEELRRIVDRIDLLTYLPSDSGDNKSDLVKLVIQDLEGTRVVCSSCGGLVDSPDVYCKHCGIKFRGWKEVNS